MLWAVEGNGWNVPLFSDSDYRAFADDALKRFGVVEPPVPVDQLIGSLGIPIRLVNLPRFFTSALVYEDGLPVMVLNWAQPEMTRRDALAHMLGHVLIVLADPRSTFPRNSEEHPDADKVAKEVIMPAMLVIEQSRIWFNDHRYLARLFAIDEKRMLDRMVELGIVRAGQSLQWDF